MEALVEPNQDYFDRQLGVRWGIEVGELVAQESLRRGSFRLSSGVESDLKFELEPLLKDEVLAAPLAAYMNYQIEAAGITFDTLGGLEKGGRLTAAAIAGTGRTFSISKELALYDRLIGDIKQRDRVLVVDDVSTSGSSIIGPINYLLACGYSVVGAAVIVDRSCGETEKLVQALGLPYVQGFSASQLLTIAEWQKTRSQRNRGRNRS